MEIFLISSIVIIAVFYVLEKNGWAALAAEYRLEGKFEGVPLFRCTANLGRWMGGDHGRVVSFAWNPQGLYISDFTPFRIFRRPLFVPWKHVSFEDGTAYSPHTKIILLRVSTIPICVRAESGHAIKSVSGK